MSNGINFTPGNNHMNSARFVNTQIKGAAQSEMAPDITGNMQRAVIKNTNEFIVQSARNLYQFFANMQSEQLRNNELSLVLKDLLNMQKDMEAFLAKFSDKNTQMLLSQMTKPEIAKLLINSQTDLSKLTLFMEQSGKEALSKLFNMTADFAQSKAVARSSQIGELIAIINACTPNSDTSQAQVLKNMMLLYLPWLPLGEQNFSIEIGSKGKNGEEEGSSEDSISILISTVNFGNVKVLIFKTNNSAVNFNISAGERFPKEKVLKALQEEANAYNIQTEMSFEKKEIVEKSFKPENAQTKVAVNMSRHLNPFLVLMAQTTVKIIINFDKNISLIETRKEKI